MSRHQNNELLEPFLQALSSRKALEIPQETVLGAVQHYMSTLPLADLPSLITAILMSDYLWVSRDFAGGDLGQAVALAVSAKAENQKRHLRTHWFASRRVSNSCARWVETILGVLETSEAKGMTKLELRTGLLAGMASNKQIIWGDSRYELEEEVILGVSELALSTAGQRELAIVCDAVDHVEDTRLRILDLQAILPFIQNALMSSLDQVRNEQVKSSRLALALGRIFEVLSNGDATDRAYMWESGRAFVNTMRNRAEASEQEITHGHRMSDESWTRHKTALFAFLVPSSTIIDILLRDESVIDGHASGDLCIEIITTLAAFSFVTHRSEGGLEGHDRVLFGALDILVALDGKRGVQRLFNSLLREEMSDAQAAFTLSCGELAVNDMNDATLIQNLLPLSQLYIQQPRAKAAFVAAHAFIAALIASVGQSNVRPLPQAAFVTEITPYYTRLLIKQLKQGDITADHFKSAYPPTVNLSSKASQTLALALIDELDVISQDPKYKHISMLTRIATAQLIPTGQLRVYLDKLADDIIETPAGEARLELAANAFGMVVRELGDAQKRIGIDWWLERKSQIEALERPLCVQPIKAKL